MNKTFQLFIISYTFLIEQMHTVLPQPPFLDVFVLGLYITTGVCVVYCVVYILKKINSSCIICLSESDKENSGINWTNVFICTSVVHLESLIYTPTPAGHLKHANHNSYVLRLYTAHVTMTQIWDKWLGGVDKEEWNVSDNRMIWPYTSTVLF